MTTCLARIAAFVIFLVTLPNAGAGAEIRVVAPSQFANTEGSGTAVPGGSGHAQVLFEASEFSALSGPHWLTAIATRPDGSLMGSATSGADYVRFKMSTTQKNTTNMSLTFAENVGADEKVVFEGGPTSTTVPVIGPPGGPKEFTINDILNDPFLYDPALGNLLIDLEVRNGTALPVDFVLTPAESSTTRHIAGPLGSPTAAVQFGGIITQFTFQPIPEPASWISLAVGVVTALVVINRRRFRWH